jgi:hypothetical protein
VFLELSDVDRGDWVVVRFTRNGTHFADYGSRWLQAGGGRQSVYAYRTGAAIPAGRWEAAVRVEGTELARGEVTLPRC